MSYVQTSQTDRHRRLTASALFVAIAYLMRFVFHFNVNFLTFEFKDAIIAIGGLYLGPLYALGMSAVVTLLEFVSISDTGVYGLLMNFICAASFSCVTSLVYRYRRTMGMAIVALAAGVLAMTALMMPANLLITPRFMGVEIQAVQALIPTLLLPFNLIKGVMNMGVVLLLYKPVTRALRATKLIARSEIEINEQKPTANEELGVADECKRSDAKKRTWIVTVAALALIAIALTIFFVCLHGKFSFL